MDYDDSTYIYMKVWHLSLWLGRHCKKNMPTIHFRHIFASYARCDFFVTLHTTWDMAGVEIIWWPVRYHAIRIYFLPRVHMMYRTHFFFVITSRIWGKGKTGIYILYTHTHINATKKTKTEKKKRKSKFLFFLSFHLFDLILFFSSMLLLKVLKRKRKFCLMSVHKMCSKRRGVLPKSFTLQSAKKKSYIYVYTFASKWRNA